MNENSVEPGNLISEKPKLSKVRKMNDQRLIAFPGEPGDYYSCEKSPDGKQVIFTKVENPAHDGKSMLLKAYLKIVMDANPEMTIEQARGHVIATLEKGLEYRTLP